MTSGKRVVGCLWIALFALPLFSQSLKDTAPHQVRFVTVENGVKLEVLDWGGSGAPVVLLAGGGDTAHVFDDFAPKLQLVTRRHVYAITRRGFGASGYEATSDPADRLGEDVLAVIESLALKRPILAGHSIAGAEMSWMANNHPERIAGAVYLDAGYPYAFDDGHGASVAELIALQPPRPPQPSSTDLTSLGALRDYYERLDGFRFPEGELRQQRQMTPAGTVGSEREFPGSAMLTTLIKDPHRYSRIPVPALFIFANPHTLGTWVQNSTDPAVLAAAEAYSQAVSAITGKQESAVKNGLPAARVITIARANHYVFLSNEGEVLTAIRNFTSALH